MEVFSCPPSQDSENLTLRKDFLQISCNWQITNNKQFNETITIEPSLQAPEKTDFEGVVSFETCISLQPVESNQEPCMLEIKVLNHQRISHIAVVSEAYVLEFFKQFGEYQNTVFAEFVDEFESNTVYFAETSIIPSATEASIKFTKTKCASPVMWIYGIKLYLTEPISETKDITTEIFNPEIIKNFLAKLSFRDENNTANNVLPQNRNVLNSSIGTEILCENAESNKNGKTKYTNTEVNNEEKCATTNPNCATPNIGNIATYIDNKFHDMETRIMNRMDEMEQRTNQKLDLILKQLESQFSIK